MTCAFGSVRPVCLSCEPRRKVFITRKVGEIIARGDRRRSTDKRPCTSLLGCRTLGETPWLDVQTVAVVLHLLICNGGKRWNPRSPSRAKRSEEHTSELQSRGHLVCR